MKLLVRASDAHASSQPRLIGRATLLFIAASLALTSKVTTGVASARETSVVQDPVSRSSSHDVAYWRAIKSAKYAVPKGESPAALILELTELLGSTDPELRDDLGYEIPVNWVYVQKLLSPDELRVWMRKLEANLRVKIGEHDTDSVLLRSFSALDLSVIAAAELEQPFLEPAEFESLLAAALTYLAAEKDVRGYVAGKGWYHSAAHTADLLKFLARNPRLTTAGQALILNAIADKLFAPATGVLTHGEDERLAAVVLSILRRPDFDSKAFEAWTDRFVAEAKPLWQTQPLDLDRLHAVQNGKNLLKSLYVDVALSPGETTWSTFARPALERALAKM